MNKRIEGSLSPSDKAKLAEIENNFKMAGQLAGPEPGIYFEFNIQPSDDYDKSPEITDRRLEFYSKTASEKANS